MDKGVLKNTLAAYSAQGGGTAATVKFRQKKLREFARLLEKSKMEIYAALTADLNRTPMETLLAELLPLRDITLYLAKKLPRLSRPRRLAGSMSTFPASTKLYREPFGRVLVISTWNYPLLLSLEPALGAYAAGNRVVLKLSSRSGNTADLIAKLLNSTFSSDEIVVIREELSLAETLEYRYDHIFLTGSSSTGRMVMRKAAENLTPCTMELGGKNPCVVTAKANLRLAARRIVWGKFFNAGQSCAAPDYLLVERDVKDKLMNLISAEIRRMYGDDPLESGMLAAMPDKAAYDRMLSLISSGRLICGGNHHPQTLSIEPTVVDRLPQDSLLFSQEIFGPVLPVKEFSSQAELMQELLDGERPLAAYCFGAGRELKKFFRYSFSCGAVIFDDVLLHFCNMNIPFGGVGSSGFGSYHGEKSFTTFTHEKPVMTQSRFIDFPLRYPPYSRFMRRMIEFFSRLW
ncbi:MAG: aldehyde dehydrogenase family protein [Lentisphaerae bacterium]|nr:aldehyde dehydrogenase family protein [Lentisphaerota bacterium]